MSEKRKRKRGVWVVDSYRHEPDDIDGVLLGIYENLETAMNIQDGKVRWHINNHPAVIRVGTRQRSKSLVSKYRITWIPLNSEYA